MASEAHLSRISKYHRHHFLYNTENKKSSHKFKDEARGIPIEEFIDLRLKMYSLFLLYRENNKLVKKKVTKGIAKHVTEQKIRHNHYKQCLYKTKHS